MRWPGFGADADDGAGEFFDPDGITLRLVAENATEDEAQALIEAGAAVVAEVCGCGGSYGDCTPEWVTHDQLRDLRQGLAPGFTGRHGAPTWIDVWVNDHGTVVFAHGGVSWGNALTQQPPASAARRTRASADRPD